MNFSSQAQPSIFVRDEGTGESVLLLHGHTLDHRVWDDVSHDLVAAGLRTLCPDLRGHGRSDRPSRGYHWSHHVADVVGVLAQRDITSAVVVGFSYGGGVALEMALEHPGLVQRLILVSPVLPDRPFEDEFMANLKQVARTIRGEGLRQAMEGPWLASPLFTPSLRRPGVRDRLAAIVRDFPGADYLAESIDPPARDWTVPERLGEIRAATVVLTGELEMAGFRGWAAEIAAGVPEARLAVVSGCGHLLPFEAPDAIVAAVTGGA